MAKEVRHTFTVAPKSGQWVLQFPVDMLRYDYCYPASENDSAQIAFSFDLRKSKVKPSELEVTLCRYAHRDWSPTDGRWESFGWEVIARGNALA